MVNHVLTVIQCNPDTEHCDILAVEHSVEGLKERLASETTDVADADVLLPVKTFLDYVAPKAKPKRAKKVQAKDKEFLERLRQLSKETTYPHGFEINPGSHSTTYLELRSGLMNKLGLSSVKVHGEYVAKSEGRGASVCFHLQDIASSILMEKIEKRLDEEIKSSCPGRITISQPKSDSRERRKAYTYNVADSTDIDQVVEGMKSLLSIVVPIMVDTINAPTQGSGPEEWMEQTITEYVEEKIVAS